MAAAKETADGRVRKQSIMIIGKSGSGKSSLSNILIGDDIDGTSFQTGGACGAVTAQVESRSCAFEGVPVQIIDTPGIPDSCSSNTVIHTDKIIKYAKEHEISVILYNLIAERFTAGDSESLELHSPVIRLLLDQAMSSNIVVKLLVQVNAKPSDPDDVVSSQARAFVYIWHKLVYKDELIQMIPNTERALSGSDLNRLIGVKFPIIPVVRRKLANDPSTVRKEILDESFFNLGPSKLNPSCLAASDCLDSLNLL
jgi:GTP-binding protein EngB required for normal cell division